MLISSLCFYSFWDWRFTGILLLSAATAWFIGLKIGHSDSCRKYWLWTGIGINLAILITFKYFNFFSKGLQQLLLTIGFAADWVTIDILLPVGLSFYTLQAISYLVDIYHKDSPAYNDFIATATFISFFPQLVAGPIERSNHLMPQITCRREWNYGLAVEGMRQILWGLFKKLAVADLCGLYVNRILDNTDYYGASTVVYALFLFTFQIYGDFSGYSDIAIGTAKLFGIRLSQNFRYPLFASSVSDFWRRWHISLMNWLKDYVYIPLGGSHRGTARTCFNIAIVFLLSGLWHGASLNFVIWGAFWAIVMIVARLLKERSGSFAIARCLAVNVILACSWILFRADSPSESIEIVSSIFRPSFFSVPTGLTPLPAVIALIAIEAMRRHEQFPLAKMMKPLWIRWLFYAALFYAIVFAVDTTDASQFIYFQF